MRAYDLRDHATGTVIPLLAAAGVGIRYQLAPGITIGLVISLILAPVWLRELRRYRGALLIFAFGLISMISGLILTSSDSHREVDQTLLAFETFRIASILGIVGTLLWTRTMTSGPLAAGSFGLGMLASVILVGGNDANLWKYSLSIPVAIIALAWASYGRPWTREIGALVVLSVVSLVSDARSLTSILALAGAVTLWQLRPRTRGARPQPWLTLVSLALLTFGVFQMMQALILEGVLGEAAQHRTQAQLNASGSLLTGGRPELGAALALIRDHPWGYGSGILLTSNDVWIAKAGMSSLNYAPNNGYVESYMFGGHIEVHSILGDMWLRFGPAGAAFALVAVGLCLHGLAARASSRSADAILVFFVLLSGWNLLFAPLETSARPLGLAIALALLPVGRLARPPGASAVGGGAETWTSGATSRN